MRKIISILLIVITLFSCTSFAACAHENKYYNYPSGTYYYNWKVKFVIVDEICDDCGQKTRYSVRRDISSIESLGAVGLAHCKIKMTFTDGTSRTYYCHHYCPNDDGICATCGGWYCRNYETNFEKALVDYPIAESEYCENLPVYAENNNPIIEGTFTAKEFCNIMPYSKNVLKVNLNTIFNKIKYWGKDEYGNETYELIADNGGIAFAHNEDINW